MNEIVELRRPTGRTKKSDVVISPGTNTARRAIQYQFTTKMGNNVKVRFLVDGENAYTVSFHVNNELKDDAKLDNSQRDPEIIPGAFHVIKTRADSLGAQELTWVAVESENDTKVVRNLDVERYSAPVIQTLRTLYQAVGQHPSKMVPSNPKLDSILGITGPRQVPDFDREHWQGAIKGIVFAIQQKNAEQLHNAIYLLGNLFRTERTKSEQHNRPEFNPGIDWMSLEKQLLELEGAIRSNEEGGWARKSNRRLNIYQRIVDKYFSQDWDIKISYNRFTLTRKTKPS